jgi:uncharacterized protein YdhG (YjbR/CyaY superfamily)
VELSTVEKRAARRKQTSGNFAAYARCFPADVQKILGKVRSTIKQAVPASMEIISYKMPAFVLHGEIVVHFAAFKAHIGMYPPVRGDDTLKRAAAPYAGPKGNLQFPYSEAIPYDLIARIARARATAIVAKAGRKR